MQGTVSSARQADRDSVCMDHNVLSVENMSYVLAASTSIKEISCEHELSTSWLTEETVIQSQNIVKILWK